MTEQAFRDWLDAYLRPQEQRSAEQIKHLFAEDAVYAWGPFNPARHGAQAIYEHHRNALSRQDDVQYDYSILAVTESHGIARFHLTIRELEDGRVDEYDGIFLVALNADGRCTRFEEWYHCRTLNRD